MLRIGTRRERNLAILTGAVIVAAAIFVLVIEPPLRRHGDLMQEKADLDLRLAKIQEDFALKNSIEQRYASIQSLLSATTDETQAVSDFLRELRDLYKGLQVKPKRIEPVSVSREKGYSLLAIRIDVEEDVGRLLNLVRAIESSPSPVAIRRCEIKGQEVRDRVSASLVVTKVVSSQTHSKAGV